MWYNNGMRHKLYIGVDVGGTKISAALVKHGGKILRRKKIPSPARAGHKKIVSAISGIIAELIDDEGIKKKAVKKVGVGVPGIVDERGVVINSPNVSLSGVNICREIRKKLDIPVLAANDVNLGILGERHFGAARGYKDIVGVFMGTGLGAGVIIEDRLLLGSHGAASEIGHMLIDPAGPKCSCGNHGCLEAYVGRWAIERDIRARMRKGESSVLSGMLPGGGRAIKSKILARALRAKDRLVTGVMKKVACITGDACVSLRHIFDPQLILLGGGVAGACGDFMLPFIREKIAKDKFFSRLGKCQVAISQLGDDATVLGAVAFCRESG
jgi:glucokinase